MYEVVLNVINNVIMYLVTYNIYASILCAHGKTNTHQIWYLCVVVCFLYASLTERFRVILTFVARVNITYVYYV